MRLPGLPSGVCRIAMATLRRACSLRHFQGRAPRRSLQGGRPPVLWGVVLLLLPVLGALETSGSLEVEMAGEMQVVSLKDNITIFCKILGPQYLDIEIMGITWFWRNRTSERDVKVFEFIGNQSKAFRPGAEVSLGRLKMGYASLQLPGIQLWEAGEYRCEVVITPQKEQGTVWLHVVAYPAISLIPQQATVPAHEDKHIVCKTSGFYPEDINITWGKWTWKVPQYQEISEGIVTDPTVKNEDGTFNATSYLKLKPSLEDNGTIYQCVVRHISLHTLQRRNCTLTVATERNLQRESVKTYFCWILLVFCIVLCFLIVIIFWKRSCRDEQTSSNDTPKEETEDFIFGSDPE